MHRLIFFISIIFLITVEILRVYLIMPFPGSQKNNSISFAYWIHNNIWWLRGIGMLGIVYVLSKIFLRFHWRQLWLLLPIGLYAAIFYFFNYRFQADAMFLPMQQQQFAGKSQHGISHDQLVIGVALNGEAKAYPVQYIGYHHQVRDSVGGVPVMVTYCTVCRTGRVYSPVVNGRAEDFRLVGMDHFNAMFEDATTGSWWQQATGEAIAGPLKGTVLQEIPSEQMSLGAWERLYPHSVVLKADPSFSSNYADLEGFDEGTISSSLEKRDSASWAFKSWVVGVLHEGRARAYDWNLLEKKRLIQDTIHHEPILIVLESDRISFHAWSRRVNQDVLSFSFKGNTDTLVDDKGSVWNMKGEAVSGPLKGIQLHRMAAYQEFWHSWKTFRPFTTVYRE